MWPVSSVSLSRFGIWLSLIQLTTGVLFPKTGKLAFAPGTNSGFGKLSEIDSPEFRRKVEKMYEQWMIKRRNEMLENLQKSLPSPEETRAFQVAYQLHFGNCICEFDPIICRLYSLVC
ncbi:hypothetical protein FO519_004293 [Halicephalobus sp. NKZ332]|nr:hypothetical protein FO519_004293 [Halicephalobus sp. NKZ332]